MADLARDYHLQLAQTRAVAASDPLIELGIRLSQGHYFPAARREVSQPVRTDRGYVVLSLKQVIPAHRQVWMRFAIKSSLR